MSMLPNILEITQRGLELLGSGTLTVRNGNGLETLHQSEVAFQFTLAPLGASVALILWSSDIERVLPSPQLVEFVGYTENGYKIEASGYHVEVRGYSEWDGKAPKRADFYCNEASVRVMQDEVRQEDPAQWVFPLLGLEFQSDYQIETHKKAKRGHDSEEEGLYFGSSWKPGFSTLDWGDLSLRFDRTQSIEERVSGVPVNGVVYLSTQPGTTVKEVMSRAAVLYDLIAPRSGVLWKPSLCKNVGTKTVHYERGSQPINGGAAYLEYPESEYAFITPYAESVLKFYDALADDSGTETKSQQALRSLSRTLIAPMFTAEQSILATSTGFEILRSHFWTGEGKYRVSKRAAASLENSLRGFAAELKSDERRGEYEQSVPAKASGLLSRPLKCVAVEIGQSFMGYRQDANQVTRMVELRNQLIHRGVMDDYPDPAPTAMAARHVLWQSFVGLVGLRDVATRIPPRKTH